MQALMYQMRWAILLMIAADEVSFVPLHPSKGCCVCALIESLLIVVWSHSMLGDGIVIVLYTAKVFL